MEFNCTPFVISEKFKENLKKSFRNGEGVRKNHLKKEGTGVSEECTKIRFELTEKSGSLSPLLSTSRTVSSLCESLNKKSHSKHVIPSKTTSRLKTLRNSWLNPKLLTPVLSSRRCKKEENFSPEIRKKVLKIQKEKKSHFKVLLKNNDFLLKTQEIFRNSRNEFNESDDPTFLSARISNDCESHQSLRIDSKRLENFSVSLEKDSNFGVSDRFTQTDNLGFSELDHLDDEEVKKGIIFISKLADFFK
jgi:hypothetical protein